MERMRHAATTRLVSPVSQTRDIDAHVVLDLRENTAGKVSF